MRDADLILHVVDIGNPRFEQQMESVDKILNEIGLDEIPGSWSSTRWTS